MSRGECRRSISTSLLHKRTTRSDLHRLNLELKDGDQRGLRRTNLLPMRSGMRHFFVEFFALKALRIAMTRQMRLHCFPRRERDHPWIRYDLEGLKRDQRWRRTRAARATGKTARTIEPKKHVRRRGKSGGKRAESRSWSCFHKQLKARKPRSAVERPSRTRG